MADTKIDTLNYIIEQAQDTIELAEALKKYPVYQEDIDNLSNYAVDIQNASDDIEVEEEEEEDDA